MNKTILIIIVILVVIGGFFLFFNKSNAPVVETPVNTTAVSEANVVYTDNGFSAKSVVIKKGGTVTFVNQSPRDMWVASSPHPIHTDYPAFDQKASITNGGSWTFTFDQAGTWGYHNHKNPSDTGTVIVE